MGSGKGIMWDCGRKRGAGVLITQCTRDDSQTHFLSTWTSGKRHDLKHN